jgi:hypothetical protein
MIAYYTEYIAYQIYSNIVDAGPGVRLLNLPSTLGSGDFRLSSAARMPILLPLTRCPDCSHQPQVL